MKSNWGRMMRTVVVFLIAIMAALNATQFTFADDRANLLGIWKVVSFVQEVQETGERRPFFGKNPTGFVILLPEGRLMAVIEGEGRKAPQTDDDRAKLFKTMIAYSGMYRFEGDKFITKVDVSWNPEWNGTDQVRFFKLEGDRLEIVSAWAPAAAIPGKPMVRGFWTLERVK
jgi:hypothetical protein